MTRPTHFRSFRTGTWLPLPSNVEINETPTVARRGAPHALLPSANGFLFVQALRYANGSVWTANMGWINKGAER